MYGNVHLSLRSLAAFFSVARSQTPPFPRPSPQKKKISSVHLII